MVTYQMHFIRTGRTSPETAGRYVGRLDLPLCPEGVDELARLAEELEYPRAQTVFTSPLRRCVQTADLLYPDTYAETLEGLADMNLGEFEGKTFEELKGDAAFTAWLKNSTENTPPGGEATLDFTARIVGAVREIFHRMMEQSLRSVAVVTHGGVIMTLLAGIGLPKQSMYEWAAANGEGFTLLFTPQMWMRDGCAEVFARIPQPPQEDHEDWFLG